MQNKVLLFDLDGTLLDSSKSISANTLDALKKCREKGYLIGIATARGEKNSAKFISELSPDIVISSGGALLKYKNEYVFKAEFTTEETRRIISSARMLCGDDCEITVDTADAHYWNYKIEPNTVDNSWGESIYSDFTDFSEQALKICVEIHDANAAGNLMQICDDCDCVRFSDSDWYKITKSSATKENAVLKLCEKSGISLDNITAFGDDIADMGMLKLCGTGVAMGNSAAEVKAVADYVTSDNDDDGVAVFINGFILI